jgi:hypothetical protein
MHQSSGGCCNGAAWTVEVSWCQRGLGVVRLLYSDTVCQAVLAWTGLSWVRPSGVFLVVKEVAPGANAWAQRPPSPLEATGSFVFLCHALDVTLSEEQLTRA